MSTPPTNNNWGSWWDKPITDIPVDEMGQLVIPTGKERSREFRARHVFKYPAIVGSEIVKKMGLSDEDLNAPDLKTRVERRDRDTKRFFGAIDAYQNKLTMAPQAAEKRAEETQRVAIAGVGIIGVILLALMIFRR